MTDSDLISRLAAHRTIGTAPREELEWLAGHGSIRTFEAGTVVTGEGEPIDSMWVVLSGHISFHGGRGATRGKIADWYAGDAAGLLPYSRLQTSPGEAIAEERTETFQLGRDQFPGLLREAPVITTALVHVMLDRARHFTTSYLQDEKMASLGKLSAGLAHELNNPASAAARSAKLLTSSIAEACAAARALGAAGLSGEQNAVVMQVQHSSVGDKTRLWSALEFGDREDVFEGWLEEHGIDSNLAPALAETALTVADLDELARELTPVQLEAAVSWISAQHSARVLTIEVERSAARIHDLVSAVKRFTWMDRATVADPVSIKQGIEDTIIVLASKTRARSAVIRTELPPDLPKVRGFGGELNQVWHNLVDNALDAISEGGTVEVRALPRRDHVVVEIRDDGSGVPADVRDRIFDPFFTTKGVGLGSGLGLDIVRRIVVRHNGDIEVESEPGCTVFRIVLPSASAGDTVPGNGLGPTEAGE
jgi:signal transduction histidine kinase